MKHSKDGERRFRLDTLLIHSAGEPEDRNGAISPPVYRASTIVFPTVAQYEASRDPTTRFDVVRYGQLGTPTTFALEQAVAAVEGGYRTALVPSGLAAVTVALQALLQSGDHLLMVDTVYGPTRHFCDTVLARFGITTTYYDPLIGKNISSLFKPNTRLVFLESPGSITFEVQDVPAIAQAAHSAGVTVSATPSEASVATYRCVVLRVRVSSRASSLIPRAGRSGVNAPKTARPRSSD